MLQELFQEHRRNLNYFFDNVNLDGAQKILDICLQCSGLLLFSGVGKSGIIAEKLAMTMISTGTKALFLPPINALHGDIGIVSKEDVVLLMSKSGAGDELISLAMHVKKRGAKIIGLLSTPHSRLEKMCDETLYLPIDRELCPFDLVPTTSAAVQLIFGDILSIALMRKKNFSLSDYAENHPAGGIGKRISLKVKDIMLKDAELPICDAKDSLKSALLELTHKRCGCLLVVDEKRNLLGIFTDGDLRRALQHNREGILEALMGDLMTASYISGAEEMLAYEAMRLMQHDPRKWVSVLPIVEKRQLRGLVRMHDIVNAGIN